MVGWASTAFSQQQGEKIIKKKIIIKTIDDNGVEQTQIIEEEIDETDLPMPSPMMEEMNRQKKVIVLAQGEQLPDDLKAEIQAMGVNLADLEQQLASAEKSVRIYKEDNQAPTLEVDSDFEMMPMPNKQGPKRKMMFKSGDEETLDIDVDIEELDGEGSGIINLNHNGEIQTFNFEGTEIPDDIKAQLEALGIDLEELGAEGANKMMMFKLDGEDMNFDKMELHKGMIWKDDEGNSFNLDDCNFKGGNKSKCAPAQKMVCCDGCSPGNCCAKCIKACTDAEKSACKSKEAKPRLGIFLNGDDSKGAVVKGVAENGAAAKSSLQKGDIIISINKTKVANNEALINIINEHKVGDKVNVKYSRAGKTSKTKVTLEAAPVRKRFKRGGQCEEPRTRARGFMPLDARHFKVDCEKACKTPMLGVMIDEEAEKGVHINGTFNKSGAVTAGLEKGDVILNVGGIAVNTSDELIAKIKQYKPGDEVEITYVRNGNTAKTKVVLTSQAISPFKSNCDCENPSFMKTPTSSKEIIIIKAEAMEELPAPKIEEKTTPKMNILRVDEFALFPNPNKGNFTVAFELENKEPLTISVVDVTGKEVYRENVKDFTGSYRNAIDVSAYAKGTYFLNILQGDSVYSQQFVYN